MEHQSVSVIIPTYNRAEIIRSTVMSVLQQTYPVQQIVVVDDGSQDNTSQVMQDLIEENINRDTEILFLQQENQGKSTAINTALDKITGDWIAFNDSDDYWLPEKLQVQFDTLAKYPDCSACFTDTRFGQEDGDTTLKRAGIVLAAEDGLFKSARAVAAKTGHGIMMQTILIRRSIMDAVGNFDPKLRVAQDSDFLFRATLETDFCYVNKPLVELDREPQRASRLTRAHPMNSTFRLQLREYMIEKWVGLAQQKSPELVSDLIKKNAAALSYLANQLLAEKRYEEARSALKKAYKLTADKKFKLKEMFIRVAPALCSRLLVNK